jgi:hypothetical protein
MNQPAVAGALFDFAAYLTSLDPPLTVGAKHISSDILEHLQAWAKLRGFDLDPADVKDWNKTQRTFAHELISVQPMPGPTGVLFLLDYTYGTTKPQRTYLATIRFLRSVPDGRYVALARIGGKPAKWGLVVDIEEVRGEEVTARVAFLSDKGDHDLMVPRRTFELIEGDRVVAKGVLS